jgi:hypothetical protein
LFALPKRVFPLSNHRICTNCSIHRIWWTLALSDLCFKHYFLVLALVKTQMT